MQDLPAAEHLHRKSLLSCLPSACQHWWTPSQRRLGSLPRSLPGKGKPYSEALSAEARDALRQAVKQLRKTIFSAEQLK